MGQPPTKPGDESDWYRFAGIGIEFIVAVLLCGGIGYWLDGRCGTAPWLMMSGFGVGFATGLYIMIRAARSMF